MSTKTSNAPSLIAYQVEGNENGKSYWTKLGAAWPNKAGGFQVKLTALPVNGELVLMPPKAE